MKRFGRLLSNGFIGLYDAVIYALAVVAGLVLVATFLAIILDVSMRNLGLPSPAWTSALSEYAMLVATMGAAPLLIRERRHVWVELIESFTGQRAQQWLSVLVVLMCVAASLVMAWYSTVMALEAAARGEVDIRSIIFPRWFLYAVLALGFGLCATEFARFLLRREDMYAKGPTEPGAI